MKKKDLREISLGDCIVFEEGMIEAWKHVKNICNVCINVHKKEMVRLRKLQGGINALRG